MACGADWGEWTANWIVGGKYEFSTYEGARAMQNHIRVAFGRAPMGARSSKAFEMSEGAGTLAAAMAGCK